MSEIFIQLKEERHGCDPSQRDFDLPEITGLISDSTDLWIQQIADIYDLWIQPIADIVRKYGDLA